MKKIVFLLTLAMIYCSCQKEDVGTFEIPMSKENVVFTAVPGGAVMKFKLPNDDRVFGLNVRYKDERNEDVFKVVGYGSDSLLLDGFNQAQQSVPVQITLIDSNNKESEPINLNFSTKDSAPYAFFDSAEVTPYWGGFQVTYSVPESVNGMAHVFYLGTNPLTHEADTILVKSFVISKSSEPVVFPLKQVSDKNTVIIRTEDHRGNRVKEQTWKDVPSHSIIQVDPKNFDFDAGGLSIENENDKLGIQYLFDGDLKGRKRLISPKVQETYTFLAGPDAAGKPFIVDLREPKLPAKIRIYGILSNKKTFPAAWDKEAEFGSVWKAKVEDKLPCKVTVYAGNDKNGDESTWQKLGQFEQNKITTAKDRWCYHCFNHGSSVKSVDELDAKDPVYLEMLLSAQTTTYRYIKIVVDELFDYYNASGTGNQDGFVTMNELEVFVKKD